MSVIIENVKAGVSQEEIVRVLRAAGLMQESTPVQLQKMSAARQYQCPEHEQMGLTYTEWFRRYVSDW